MLLVLVGTAFPSASGSNGYPMPGPAWCFNALVPLDTTFCCIHLPLEAELCCFAISSRVQNLLCFVPISPFPCFPDYLPPVMHPVAHADSKVSCLLQVGHT